MCPKSVLICLEFASILNLRLTSWNQPHHGGCDFVVCPPPPVMHESMHLFCIEAHKCACMHTFQHGMHAYSSLKNKVYFPEAHSPDSAKNSNIRVNSTFRN